MRKVVHFCAGGGSRPDLKNFTTALVKQRAREFKKSLKFRFRQLIRDYRTLFKQGKDLDILEKQFKNDLFLLMQEAIQDVTSKAGNTINRALGMTAVVPDTRKVSNKINVVVRRVDKFYKKNGYMNKQLTTQFNELFVELIDIIAKSVMGDNINEEALGKEDYDENEVEEMALAASATKRFSATKVTLFAAKESIEDLINSEDLEDINEMSDDSITFDGDEIPETFSAKASKISRRVKTFNSNMKPISIKLESDESMPIAFANLIEYLVHEGILKGRKHDYNYDAVKDGNFIKFTIYVDEDNYQPTPDQVGIYEGKELPDEAEPLVMSKSDPNPEPKGEEFMEVTTLIDEGLSTMNMFKLEKIVKNLDHEKLEAALIAKYGNNPISNLMK